MGYTQIFERIFMEMSVPFHQCFSRTSGLVVISGKTHLDRKTVLHKNSQNKGNDFRPAVVAVKSRTYDQQNGKNIQKYHAYFVHFHGRLPHNEFSGSYFSSLCSANLSGLLPSAAFPCLPAY